MHRPTSDSTLWLPADAADRLPNLLRRRPHPRGPAIFVSRLVDCLFPQTCGACDRPIQGRRGVLCERCRAALAAQWMLNYCTRCGRAVPAASLRMRDCGRCARERMWNAAGLVRVGSYVHVLRRLILDLKFRGRERSAEILGALLAERIAAAPWRKEIEGLTPVPMHWLRRCQRPCNHAAKLTEVVARHLRLPVVRLVRRARYAPSQTQFASRTRRFANVAGCFAPTRNALRRRKWAGRTICVVDNFLSSGATLQQVIIAAKKAGARRVYAAVVGRSLLRSEQSVDEALLALPQSAFSGPRGSAMNESAVAPPPVPPAGITDRDRTLAALAALQDAAAWRELDRRN
jgi:predicted amidophosphoribosyltransferase